MATKTEEYRSMPDDHLELARKELVKHLFQLRFQSATERLETPSEIKKARRDLARILTLQRQRQLEARKQQPAQTKGK